MLLTEKEAKSMWCPQARVDVRVKPNEINPSICIGSKCMAWRFSERLVNGPDSYQSEPGPTGYCGLAGEPR